MTIMKGIAIAFAVIGFGFGIASAWYWWKSSKEMLVIPNHPNLSLSGTALATGPLADYFKRVSALNAKAAICGAIGVLLATIAGIVGTVGS
jgi:hypothetical protein